MGVLYKHTTSGRPPERNGCPAEGPLLAARSRQSTASARADPARSSSAAKMGTSVLHVSTGTTSAAKGRSELPGEPSFPSLPRRTIGHRCPGAIRPGVRCCVCVEGCHAGSPLWSEQHQAYAKAWRGATVLVPISHQGVGLWAEDLQSPMAATEKLFRQQRGRPGAGSSMEHTSLTSSS